MILREPPSPRVMTAHNSQGAEWRGGYCREFERNANQAKRSALAAARSAVRCMLLLGSIP
jgi:hypothetical protein